MDEKDILAVQDAIIGHILGDFPQEGWSWPALRRAAQQAGYEGAMAGAIFPGGLSQAAGHLADMADRAMLAALAAQNPHALRTPQKIEQAVMARFEFLKPFKAAERACIAYHALPWHKPQGARILWRTADRIWSWAGDRSADYNYYTKRSLLCGVLAASALAFLGDESPQLSVTRGFLRRRLSDVAALGGVMSVLKAGLAGRAA